MVWEPFLLAIALGLIVSAGIYFALLWPGVEPEDDDEPVAATAPPRDGDSGTPPVGTLS